MSDPILNDKNYDPDVAANQQRLQQLGYYNGIVDGMPGPQFTKAVLSFQKTKGLKQDGSLGPQTQNILTTLAEPKSALEAEALMPGSTTPAGGMFEDVQAGLKAGMGETNALVNALRTGAGLLSYAGAPPGITTPQETVKAAGGIVPGAAPVAPSLGVQPPPVGITPAPTELGAPAPLDIIRTPAEFGEAFMVDGEVREPNALEVFGPQPEIGVNEILGDPNVQLGLLKFGAAISPEGFAGALSREFTPMIQGEQFSNLIKKARSGEKITDADTAGLNYEQVSTALSLVSDLETAEVGRGKTTAETSLLEKKAANFVTPEQEQKWRVELEEVKGRFSGNASLFNAYKGISDKIQQDVWALTKAKYQASVVQNADGTVSVQFADPEGASKYYNETLEAEYKRAETGDLNLPTFLGDIFTRRTEGEALPTGEPGTEGNPIPVPKTQEEFDKLPDGTWYKDKEGVWQK